MEGILRLSGIGIVEQNGLYRILPITEVSKEPLPVSQGRDPDEIKPTGKVRLQVIPIKNVASSDFITTITPFLPANAVIMDIPKTNEVALVDTDSNIKRMLGLVEVFDKEQTNRRTPEMFVYPLHYGKAKEVAAMLQQVLSGAKPSAPGIPQPKNQPPNPAVAANPQSGHGGGVFVSDITKIYPNEGVNSLVVVATPEDYATITKMIEKLDVPQRQVSVEGIIAEVTLTDNMSLGMSWNATISKNGRSGILAQNPGDLTGITPTSLTGSGFTFVGIDSQGTVRALVTALAAGSKAKVLAAPHILVSDSKEAKIQVGSQVPVVTSTTIAAAGVPAQQTIQYQDTGVILKVKPSVTESGLVSLDLTQEVSTYHTETLFDNQQEIIIDKTQAATNMEVQDGQTIVIGGLIREDRTDSNTGIPLLSKIPIIGYLFGDSSVQKSRNEIVILLTPHVIKNAEDAKRVTSDYVDKFSDVNDAGIKKNDLIRDNK